MNSNSVLQENYKLTIHLVVQQDDHVLKEDLLTFDLGFSSEICLPSCVEEQILNLQLGESACFQSEWNEDWSRFLHLQHITHSTKLLNCKITLKNIVKPKEVWEMNEDQKFAFSEKMKGRGNFANKNGDLKKSYRCYKSVIRTLEGSVSVTEGRCEASRDLLLAAYLNAAFCLLKWERYLPSIHVCNRALELSANNVKALYRRAKAYMGLKYFAEAEKDFAQCLEIEATSSLFKKELTECRKQLGQCCKTEAELYKKMFSKLGYNVRNDSDEMPWTRMDEWSNQLADQMMSLPEELEAFGEKMPELKPVGRKSKFTYKTDDLIES